MSSDAITPTGRSTAGIRGLLRWGTILLTYTLIVSPLFAQDRPEKTCLWRVHSSNTTAYLQGSLHLLTKEDHPLPLQIETAFSESKHIVLEMDLSVMTDPDAQIRMLLQGMLPQGQELATILKPATLKLAERSATEAGLHMAAFKHYKPWMFVMVLTATKLQQLGFSPDNGLDFYFYKLAVELNKQITGLETLDEQLACFDAMMTHNPDAFVRQSLEDFSQIETELTTIIGAWRQGDLAALSKSLLKNLDQYPDVHRILIKERNKKWMTTLKALMQSGTTTMIIVGAGHLPGDDGLLELLKAQGYTLEQL